MPGPPDWKTLELINLKPGISWCCPRNPIQFLEGPPLILDDGIPMICSSPRISGSKDLCLHLNRQTVQTKHRRKTLNLFEGTGTPRAWTLPQIPLICPKFSRRAQASTAKPLSTTGHRHTTLLNLKVSCESGDHRWSTHVPLVPHWGLQTSCPTCASGVPASTRSRPTAARLDLENP